MSIEDKDKLLVIAAVGKMASLQGCRDGGDVVVMAG